MTSNYVDISFPKREKLCSTKSMDILFSSGESFVAFPLRVVYIVREKEAEDDSDISVLISVSKKKFKRAVKRNRIKRLIREAYRLNKFRLDTGKVHIDIAFLYLKNELPTYAEIDKAMVKTMAILSEKIEGGITAC